MTTDLVPPMARLKSRPGLRLGRTCSSTRAGMLLIVDTTYKSAPAAASPALAAVSVMTPAKGFLQSLRIGVEADHLVYLGQLSGGQGDAAPPCRPPTMAKR